MAKAAKKAKATKGRRGRPVTTGRGQLIGVRVLPAMVKRIDDWQGKNAPDATRQEAMRRLIERGLDAPAK